MTEWIMIKDKLPPVYKDVMFFLNFPSMRQKIFIGIIDDNLNVSPSDTFSESIVFHLNESAITHWMLLPVPPTKLTFMEKK